MFKKPTRVIAIDFGSSQIRTLLGEQTKDGSYSIIGYGTSQSDGAISKGVIQDMEAARHKLREALEMAHQKTTQISPKLIAIGVNTPSAETCTKEGVLKLKNEEITEEHLYEVLEIAQKEINESGRELLTSISSYEFYIDNLGVQQPLGMKANQLKIRVHITLVPRAIIENLRSCIESELYSSYSMIYHFIYNPIATALGSLTPEDMELGTLIIDMGKTTTNLTLLGEHKLIYASTFDFGNIIMSRDLSNVFKVTFEEADKLVYDYGISEELIKKETMINLSPNNSSFSYSSPTKNEVKDKPIFLQSTLEGFNRNISRIDLEGVIYARAQEMILTLKEEIEKKNFKNLFLRGIVLSGGGAKIKNMDMLIGRIFNSPIRIARPQGFPNIPQPINDPVFATVAGILRHGFVQYNSIQRGYAFQNKKVINQLWNSLSSPFKTIFSKTKRD
ncbi:MAG TPA: cell division protein FtsA [Candidatus Hydrogenedens sp.]|nr:cell division protein FtsA [Candidatus Hydrogenedens sp.]